MEFQITRVFQIATICMLVVFYGCFFIKIIYQRIKGTPTGRSDIAKEDNIAFTEYEVAGCVCFNLIVELISIYENTTIFPTWLRIAGGCLLLAGVVLSICAMAGNWRGGVPTSDKKELVTKGIYRSIRYPEFLGFDLVYVGVLILFFNWELALISALCIAAFRLQIVNTEEQY
jgi:protein-S-isoprenylcysteine O-methyltransferase Ste14